MNPYIVWAGVVASVAILAWSIRIRLRNRKSRQLLPVHSAGILTGIVGMIVLWINLAMPRGADQMR